MELVPCDYKRVMAGTDDDERYPVHDAGDIVLDGPELISVELEMTIATFDPKRGEWRTSGGTEGKDEWWPSIAFFPPGRLVQKAGSLRSRLSEWDGWPE